MRRVDALVAAVITPPKVNWPAYDKLKKDKETSESITPGIDVAKIVTIIETKYGNKLWTIIAVGLEPNVSLAILKSRFLIDDNIVSESCSKTHPTKYA